MKERKIFEACGLQLVIDVSMTINHVIKSKTDTLKLIGY